MKEEKEKQLIKILRRWIVLNDIVQQLSKDEIEIIYNIALRNESYVDSAKKMGITRGRYLIKMDRLKKGSLI